MNKEHLAFGTGDFSWARCDNPAIAAYYRTYEDADAGASETILIVQNLSGAAQDAVIILPERTSPALIDLLTKQVLPVSAEQTLEVHLEPYQYFWLEC